MQNTNLESRALALHPANDAGRLVPLIQFIAASELVKEPRPLEWDIRGVFLRGTTVAVIGAPATFKSFGALDMAACIAAGIDWHGRPTRQGAVFYLAGEGNAGISRRLKAWEIVHGSLASAPLYVSTGGIGLIDPLNAAAVAAEVQRLSVVHNVSPTLVVVDTLARNFGGGDENSTADMGKFIANLDLHIREPLGCTVKIVHHSGHADRGRGRGSSALHAAVDTEIIFERDGSTVMLKCSKSKDGPEFEPMAFETRVVELPWTGEDGNPEKSFVLHPTSLPSPKAALKLGKHEERALAVLERLYDEAHERLSKAGRERHNAAVTIDEWKEAFGLDNRQRFFDVKGSLKRKDLIRLEAPHVFLV